MHWERNKDAGPLRMVVCILAGSLVHRIMCFYRLYWIIVVLFFIKDVKFEFHVVQYEMLLSIANCMQV